jgi:cyclomaltodextrinase
MNHKKIKWFLLTILFALNSTCLTIYCQSSQGMLNPNEKQARIAPEWITSGIIYQIQPRAFTPEGTLKAAIVRLPEVAELGINIIYLCPVFVADDDMDQKFWSPRQKASGMNNPRNPYRMKDYYHVDPEYGTDNDLKEFITEAHKLGMRVMLDMVYLHCGPTAVFLKDHPDFIKRDKDGNPINAAWAFPALNFTNPELREYLWKNMEYWVTDFKVDGFRCDVASNIPLDFWETGRDRLEKIFPEIGMLAEGEREEDQLKAFDLNYSFTWFNAIRLVMEKGESASILRKTWEKMMSANPKGSRFIRYIDNHDLANEGFHNRLEKVWGPSGVNVTLVMSFTLDGVPFLYNGQEIGDTARHSIFGRLPINWADGNTPAGKARFAFCKKLSAMRHGEPSLTRGEFSWIENDAPDAVVSFVRTLNGEKILTVLNLTGEKVTVKVNGLTEPKGKSFKSLLAEKVKGNTQNGFELQAYGFWVGKMKSEK